MTRLATTASLLASTGCAGSPGEKVVEVSGSSGVAAGLEPGGSLPAGASAIGGAAGSPGATSTGGLDGNGGSTAVDTSEPCPSLRPPERGLRIWLNAASGVELEGGGVSRWRNAIDGEPPATQGEPGKRPTLIDSAINGRPAVHLDGEDDLLALDFPVGGKEALTLAAVARTWEYQRASPNPDCGESIGRELNCSGTDQSLLCWTEEGNTFSEQGIFFGVGQREATFRFGTGDAYPHFKTPFVLEYPNEDRFVFSLARLDGADRSLFLNGQVPRGRANYETDELLELTARAGGSGAVRAEPIGWIGKGRFNAATSFWAGEVAELFVYDLALDDEERRELEAYVKCNYFPNGYSGVP